MHTNRGKRFVYCVTTVFCFLSKFWLGSEHVSVEALSIPRVIGDPNAHRSQLYAKKQPETQFDEASSQEDTQLTYIRFSRAFQRHVVYQETMASAYRDCQRDDCLESFLFLDEAIAAYPDATFEKSLDIGAENDEDDFQLIVAGIGTIPSSHMLSERNGGNELTADARKTLCYLASLAMVGQRGKFPPPGSDQLQQKRDMFLHKLGSDISPKRFESHSPETIERNYIRVMDLLTRGRRKVVKGGTVSKVDCLLMDWTQSGLSFEEADARAVIAAFPQLCLYDIHEIEERIKFMIFPKEDTLPSNGDVRKKGFEVDYYQMMRSGRGVGLTIKQATKAIKAVPQLLSIYHEDSRKPSMLYFYRDLNVASKTVEAARTELANSINGCDGSDLLSFAYLNSLGVSWKQIKLLLDASPVITYCETEPGWELLDNGPVRNTLDTAMLNFLRKRLQITNSDLHSMIKTHSRLTTYSVKSNLLPKLNAIQDRLILSTRELQRIVLRMPSVTGMSVSSSKGKKSALQKRIDFFINEAQLSPIQLKESIIKQPSLLQYSVESTLRPKLNFLTDDLNVDKSDVARIIRAAPAVMGLSLENNLRPKVAMMRQRCNLTSDQIGNLVVTVPLILLLSLKQNIEITLNFLTSELGLSSDDLSNLIQSCPRILLQGVETSLFFKINMLRDAFVKEGHSMNSNSLAIETIKKNPSLLVTTNAILQSRIGKCQKKATVSLSETLKPRRVRTEKLLKSRAAKSTVEIQDSVPSRTRNQRVIIEVTNDKVINEFKSVKDAAALLGVSTSSIYTACAKGKQIKGRILQYRDAPQAQDVATSQGFSFDDIKASPFTLYDKKSDSVSLVAFASGCIYPRDNIDTARGMRKAGGIAIQIPQVTQIVERLDSKFQEATRMSFGMIMSETEGGTNPHKGFVLAGFPFLRPSRNRCDLYACHGALKVVLQLLKQAAEERDMRNTDVDIVIFTDSTYAWKLLKDSDNLLEWGSASCQEEVKFDINGPLSLANPDLLFPLTKTMHRMSNNAVINRRRNKRLCIGNNISISFRYIGDLRYDRGYAKQNRELHNMAEQAAMWQFDKG